MFKVALAGQINDCGVIRPRYSVKVADLEKYESRYLPTQDFGADTHYDERRRDSMDAKKGGVGGKLMAFVY